MTTRTLRLATAVIAAIAALAFSAPLAGAGSPARSAAASHNVGDLEW